MHKTITKFLKIYIKKILKYYFLINNFSVSFFFTTRYSAYYHIVYII